MKKDLYGAILIGLALLTFLSVISFSEFDPPFGSNVKLDNLIGYFGVYYAGWSRIILGYSFYLPPLIFAIIGLLFFRGKDTKYILNKVLLSLLIILTFSGLLGVLTYDFKVSGLLGLYISYRLTPFLGFTGSVIILLTFFIWELFSLSDLTFGKLINSVEEVFKNTVKKIKEKYDIDRKERLKKVVEQSVDERESKITPFKTEKDQKISQPEEKTEKKEKRLKDIIKIIDIKENLKKKKDNTKENSPVSEEKNIQITEEESDSKGANQTDNTQSNGAKKEGENINMEDVVNKTEDEIKKIKKKHLEYKNPSINLLNTEKDHIEQDKDTFFKLSHTLESTLNDFGIDAKVVKVSPGPVITLYEIEPAPGVAINKIVSRENDIKLRLAVASLRIIAPIPGKSAVGIEVPNKQWALIRLGEIINSPGFSNKKNKIPLAIGKDVFGNPKVIDLASMPHLLIGGATGSGKSVCINTIIISLLYKFRPDQLKLILIDPKRVELKGYNAIPHLISPTINNPKEATNVLKWLVSEMEERYKILAQVGARNIDRHNEMFEEKILPEDRERMPYIVAIIDELADLMMSSAQKCEQYITRLTQMARAVGIHLILATQRPSVDVITGLIKSNMPARIAFQVSSKIDSRTILDSTGAVNLLGRGDMLYLLPTAPKPARAHGAFLTDKEIENIVEYVKSQGEPDYILARELEKKKSMPAGLDDFDDDIYDDVKEFLYSVEEVSTSMLQRRFKIGYNRAARIIDMLEVEGFISAADGVKPRKVLKDNFDE